MAKNEDAENAGDSQPFWGWVFQFAGKMKIIAPDEIVAEYRSRAMSVVE